MKNLKHFPILLILAVTLFSSQTFAQDSENKLSMGFAISPDLCYRFLRVGKNEFKGSTYQKRKEVDRPRFGNHIVFNVERTLNERYSLSIGFGTSDLGFKTKSNSYQGSILEEWTVREYYHYYFIDFPISLSTTVGSNKLKFKSDFFISPSWFYHFKRVDFLLPVTNPTVDETKVVGKESTEKVFNTFIGIRAGIKYDLNSKWSLTAQPEFKFGVFRNDGLSHLWSLGLNVGCYYNL